MRTKTLVALVVAALTLAACQGPVAPSTAVAGSTILIPLDGTYPVLTDVNPQADVVIGYGGTDHDDFQRGEMLYRLKSKTNGTTHPLTTRATSRVVPHPTTIAYDSYEIASQIVSAVDIPSGTPADDYDFEVVRKLAGQEITGYAYNGDLTVVAGSASQTLFQFFNWFTSSFLVAAELYKAIPNPEIRFDLSAPVHALEISLDYPGLIIDVKSVIAPKISGMQRGPITWINDDSATGHVVASLASQGLPFDQVSLVFTLDDGANATLDPALIVVPSIQVQGYDEDGFPLSVSIVPPLTIH
ncbi:MAG: hypothetical protein GY937_08630 [bacterium]|nr:hypothetical protein [bacterium]